MGKHTEGWKLLKRGGVYYVRFRHGEGKKNRHCISTGKSDKGAASAEAGRIYGHIVRGGKSTRSRVVLSLEPIETLLSRWVLSLDGVLDAETVKTYEGYAGSHWNAFRTLDDMLDEAKLAEYARARLRRVLKKTVYKELSALRGFMKWCKEQGAIAELPMWPELPRQSKGKRSGTQREKANDLSPEQVDTFLTALPWMSERTQKGRHFPVRARFLFAYETGLRPSTIDALTWDHVKGGELRIDDEDDKARYGRTLPLSDLAKSVLARLDNARPANEPIFGRHDYRVAIAKACTTAGIDLAIAPYDFRHARGTHLVDQGASLTGVAQMLGHTQVTTTNKYVRGSRRAAEAALATDSGSKRDQESLFRGAKEGGRTPTSVTSLEPERGESVQNPANSGFIFGQGIAGNGPFGLDSGGLIPFVPRSFSLGFDAADAFVLALAGEEGLS